jgi:hypothetical protein
MERYVHAEIATDNAVFSCELLATSSQFLTSLLSTKVSEQQQQQHQNADGVYPDVFSNTQVIHIWAKIKSIKSMKWVNGGFKRCGMLPGTSPSDGKSMKPNA